MLIQKTIHMKTTVTHLWEVLTDPEKLKIWSPSVISDEPISSGPPGVGFQSIMKITEGSNIVEYESEITCYDVEIQLGMVLRGGSLGKGAMHVTYTLQPDVDSTILNYESRWQAHGLTLRLMSPIITKMARKNIDEQMTQLKIVAEAES